MWERLASRDEKGVEKKPQKEALILDVCKWGGMQVWSLSSYEVSPELFMNDFNQVLYVSFLMTS